ncbi:MAG: Uncharacterized protein CEN91_101 [Candidatus Berkelbacteria bacterium Licking1014_85]|uniref:phenylalanine--tRNA ligase n=1 Tax=Candidatus Berkelbacteria bacterium Licking1014_85 TaxID=2017148 RepID=A0A554LLV4_9BACT|nr:MAG: Uncharacterized protein CEN91_101 [Candidatus Berkelbacteria bacterium Licking1014_85]
MIYPLDWLKEYVKLPEDLKELADICIALGYDVENITNEIIDLEITPNRGDVLSIIGLARDLGIFLNQKIELPNNFDNYNYNCKTLKFNFETPKLVSRFSGLIVENIKIQSSPEYIQTRLKLSGINPINNIVDLTNYIMLECGQPLHAFDLNKIGSNFLIRFAKINETVTTLDGINRKLSTNNLIAESNNKIIDLIGIMGGENSAVDNNTMRIFIQAGIFDAQNIRQTSKKLNLKTEASYRYERQIDFSSPINALELASKSINENNWGKIIEQFDIINQKPEEIRIPFDTSKINHLIGENFDANSIRDSLQASGCEIKDNVAIIPSHRFDLKIWQDLAEEITRIYGYNKLTRKIIDKTDAKPNNSSYWKIVNLMNQFIDEGFFEVKTYSFVSKNEIPENTNPVLIPNPMSKEFEAMRTSLVPQLVKVFSKNPWDTTTKIFEAGNVFNPTETTNFALASWKPLGIEGEQKLDITDNLAKLYKIRKPIYYFEVSLEEAYKIFKPIDTKPDIEELTQYKYVHYSQIYPTIIDISFIIDKNQPIETIESEILQLDKHIFQVEMFDSFASAKIGEKNISYAYHIMLENCNKEKTENITQMIYKIIKEKYNATIR